MKYFVCLLLSCLLFLSRATMAKEYEVVVSLMPASPTAPSPTAPVSVVPHDTNCLVTQTGRVGFGEGAARSKVNTTEDLISSCAKESSGATFYAVDTKGQPKIIFKFYKPKGAEPYLIPIMVSPDLSCKVYNNPGSAVKELGCHSI
ncbi:hypothetical protein [Candidatus Sororendozoicomonas aggregata]|uniref:hypothetical protein n=1 Tax=Candidatus Sororendozoicomonas aggregata TaxID=3073239 RepID=UPI002ED21344